jgi:hypothetical protein
MKLLLDAGGSRLFAGSWVRWQLNDCRIETTFRGHVGIQAKRENLYESIPA